MISNLLFLETAPVGVFDILLGILFLAVLLFFASSKKAKMIAIPGNDHYKYYVYNIYFKVFFAILYGAIYKYYYHGGDTMAYWNGAANLNNLFWESPIDYWNEMMATPVEDTIQLHFSSETGYPPIWIYRDPNSFFVSKLVSIIMIVFGQSYIMITLALAFFLSKVSWSTYELVRSYKLTNDHLGAIAILFIPSVSFWCAGLSKDTVVLISVLIIFYNAFNFMNRKGRKTIPILFIVLYLFILYNTRSFMVMTLLAPLFIAYSTRVIRKYNESVVLKNTIRLFIFIVSTSSFLLFFQFKGEELIQTTNSYLNEAAVSHDDFVNNKSYGNKRYELEVNDYSALSMLKAAPKAIIIAIYRPGLWEARSPLLLISGIETFGFLLLTLLFIFKGNVLKKIRFIQTNELLLFGFFFVISMAFFTGFTSILFGILVRFKAPFLPFLAILLTIDYKNKSVIIISKTHEK